MHETHEAGANLCRSPGMTQFQPALFPSHVGGWRLYAGENANHQLLLAVDTWVVGELYSGLPNWKDHFSANVSFTAPQVPWIGNTGMACVTEVRMDPGSELGSMGYNLTYL